MPIIKYCVTCNTQFKVPPSLHAQKYCSVKCNDTKGLNNPNWKGGLSKVNCKECKKEFFLKKKDVLTTGNCCSKKCNGITQSKIKSLKHLKKRIIKNCLICKKEILVKPSHKDIEGTYCSVECMSSGYKTRLAGINNPNYKNGGISNTKEYKKAASIKFKLKNPEKIKCYSHNAKIKRKQAIGKLSFGIIKKLYEIQKGLCVCCKHPLGEDYHLDHIMPLALGGTNTDDNVQLLKAKCNLVKNAKHPIDYMQSKGFLL